MKIVGDDGVEITIEDARVVDLGETGKLVLSMNEPEIEPEYLHELSGALERLFGKGRVVIYNGSPVELTVVAE